MFSESASQMLVGRPRKNSFKIKQLLQPKQQASPDHSFFSALVPYT